MTDAVVTRLAAEFAPELIPSDLDALFDSIEWDQQHTLMPGIDWRDDKLYFTVSGIPQRVTKKKGKGKDAVETEELEHVTLFVRSDRHAGKYTPETVADLGFQFPPIYAPTQNIRWDLHDLRAYVKEPKPAPPGKQLHATLREVYLRYVEYADPIHYDLVPLFIMASYIYRMFQSFGYIHFNGTAASGKTQNLKLLQAFGFNTLRASSISPSALFRTITSSPGVLCLDEIEHLKDDNAKDLRSMILDGYERGAAVMRSEQNILTGKWENINFPAYCPKVFASIKPQDDVVASRCIVIPMSPAIRKIPEFNQDDPRWGSIRNNLYRWALDNGQRIAAAIDEWNDTKRHTHAPELQNRQWQIAQAYFIIADAIDRTDLIEPLLAFFTTYYAKQQQLQNDTDKQRMLMRSLPRVLRTIPCPDPWYYSIRDIHTTAASFFQEDELEYFKTRQATSYLRALGFTQTKQTKGGLHFYLDPDFVRAELARRHIDPFDEDINWYEERPSTPPALQDATLDWLSEYAERED